MLTPSSTLPAYPHLPKHASNPATWNRFLPTQTSRNHPAIDVREGMAITESKAWDKQYLTNINIRPTDQTDFKTSLPKTASKIPAIH